MKDKKRIERDITAIKTCITNYQADLAEAEKELAELEKPKLRQGDVFVDDICVVTIGKSLDGRWIATHKDGSQKIGDETLIRCHIQSMNFMCNPIDDLKALSEPLEKFEMDNGSIIKFNVKWLEDCLIISQKSADLGRDTKDHISICKKYLPEFILNLRRMQAGEKK